MATAGFPVCEEIFKINVGQYTNDIGKIFIFKAKTPSRGWEQKFLNRHPTISKRTENRISKRQIVTKNVVRSRLSV